MTSQKFKVKSIFQKYGKDGQVKFGMENDEFYNLTKIWVLILKLKNFFNLPESLILWRSKSIQRILKVWARNF